MSDAFLLFFFFNDTATTEIYTLSLHDALPISRGSPGRGRASHRAPGARRFSGRRTALRRVARAPRAPRGAGPRAHARHRDITSGPGSLPGSRPARRGAAARILGRPAGVVGAARVPVCGALVGRGAGGPPQGGGDPRARRARREIGRAHV